MGLLKSKIMANHNYQLGGLLGPLWDRDNAASVDLHTAADERRQRIQNEYALKIDAKPPDVGTLVILNAEMLGMGHSWVRLEATVLEKAETCCKVRFSDRKNYNTNQLEEMWIHPSVITDTVAKEPIEQQIIELNLLIEKIKKANE